MKSFYLIILLLTSIINSYSQEGDTIIFPSVVTLPYHEELQEIQPPAEWYFIDELEIDFFSKDLGYINFDLLTKFNTEIPYVGKYIVVVGLVLFAFSTIIGWSYYGEKCAEFIFGSKIIIPYRVLWIIIIPIGAATELNLIWLIADIMNGLMALPNLIALILLSPIVFSKTKQFIQNSNEN